MSDQRARRFFFVVNQDLLDGSGHALYCFRHCWWLAKTRPEIHVNLLSPGKNAGDEAFQSFGHDRLANFEITSLAAIRKKKGGRGFTLNAVYHWNAARYLGRRAQQNDLLVTASFPKLFRFLLNRASLRAKFKTVYEAHQLAFLDGQGLTAKARFEFETLAKADVLVTTTEPLRELLQQYVPSRHVHNLGLACGFDPETFPARTGSPEGVFRLGYIGSVYREQGVEWLIENWNAIQKEQPRRIALAICGGSEAQAKALRTLAESSAAQSVTIRSGVAPSDLRSVVAEVDALIIPSLPEGRMPFVAITKAYDYLGLSRPILASNLPTISEIIRPAEGFLFQAGDVGSLRTTLAQLLKYPEKHPAVVEAAAHRAKELSWRGRAERWWRCVDEESF